MLFRSVLSNTVGASLTNGVSTEIGFLSLLHVWGNLVWPPIFRIEYGAPLTVATLAPGAACGALAVAALVCAYAQGPALVFYERAIQAYLTWAGLA